RRRGTGGGRGCAAHRGRRQRRPRRSERGGADVVAATAAVTGVVAFLAHRRQGEIPQNVTANARHRAQRDSTNVAIRGRNADRIAATALLVSPAAGEGAGP